ncbi:MAG: hypothetical protein INH41_27075 [Myxococcaceae bacterium]|jgi:hypothetical protein|nr:hypothetical protein [Myxococcaceae bacterium]MCA3016064.1 hypothetical protein [Myxococcaceae bacterium]
MSDDRRLIRALPARSVEDVIAELAAAQVRVARGEPLSPPVVTLHLAIGLQATGEIVDILFDQRRGTTLLLHLAGTSRHDRSSDVIYVKADAVAALTVHSAAGHVALLSAGQVATPPGPPPTRLEARRALERLRHQLTQRLGAEIALDAPIDETPAEQLAGLVELATQVFTALQAVVRDDLGLEAVRQQVKTVRLRAGAAFGLTLAREALEASAPWAEHPKRWAEPSELTSRLEALL